MPVTAPLLRLGTRGSPLALAQAEETRRRLVAAHGLEADAVKIVVIRTSGDRIQDRPLAEAGGKGLFTKEIEEALLAGTIDLAVHSAKDVPTFLPDGLELVGVLPREDARDAFVARRAASLDELPPGAVVGTSSLRRAAQVKRRRPDVGIVPFRGNVETRLKKLDLGEADATLLAMAGLNRLRLSHVATAPLSPDMLLPAVGQGAIALEARADDRRTRALVAAVDDPISGRCLACERAYLAVLDGSCRTPIAGLARAAGSGLAFDGLVLLPDGSDARAVSLAGEEPVALGRQAGEDLLAAAGPAFLAAIR